MYRALYRKWRPQVFADVIGQQAITTALQNQITHDKVGHAYLFTGTRGTGKTTCAKLFARAVNCENRTDAEPCGECEVCIGLERGGILDVSEIDAASNNGVDDVRELREETAYRPSRCKYRVYIIDEVHMLSTSAFNALLKILEEPPSHVVFILATTEIHKVPATILSRCQRFDFMRISPEVIAKRLLHIASEEQIQLSEAAADLIARLADGSMRDACSLLDTCAGTQGSVDEAQVRKMAGVADKDYLFAFSDAISHKDAQKALVLLGELWVRSLDVRRLTDELVHHYRNIILAKAQPSGELLSMVPAEDVQKYVQIAQGIGEAFAVRAMRRFAAAMDRMGRVTDARIELELALFELCAQPQEPAPQADTTNVQKPKMSESSPVAVTPVQNVQKEQPQNIQEAESAPPRQEAPETKPEQNPHDGLVLFEQWPQVVQQMASINRMLYSFMKNSKAYFDGKRVLIQADEMFITHMRETEDANSCIKRVIEQVTGKRYGIGPYTPTGNEPTEKPTSAKETLKKWQEMGVEVEYN